MRIKNLLKVLLFASLWASVAWAEHAKLVVILPLSGRLANIGQDLQNAISLQSTSSVSLVYEDDAFDPKNTVTVVQKYASDPETKGFLFFGSGTTLAAKPLVERAKIPAVSVAMTDKIVEGSSYLFRYYPPGSEQAARIIKEISGRSYKNVAFVVSQQEAMIGIEEYFKKHLAFSSDHYFEVPPGDTDLKSVALKVSTLKPDAVCLLLLPPELPAFAKQVRALGYQGEFFGPTQVGNPNAVKAADQALENTWFTGVDEAPARDLIATYRTKFGFTPTSEAIAAYDAIGLLSLAAMSPNPIDVLRNPTGFSGIFGKELKAIPPNTFAPPIALKRIKGTEFVQEP